jgi:hypothetical protein
MSLIIEDIQSLYQQFFGSKPQVGGIVYNTVDNGGKAVVTKPKGIEVTELPVVNASPVKLRFTNKGYPLLDSVKDVEIWLPTRLYNLPFAGTGGFEMKLPYSIVSISGQTNIVRTAVSERKGTVKELYNIDDYKINIKGFFIDKEKRGWPEEDIYLLKQLHESGEAFNMENALISPFLEGSGLDNEEQQRLVITAFNLPEVEGKKYVRPFSMSLESDCVFTLEYNES